MKTIDITLLLFLAWTYKCSSITVITTERSTETQWTCFDTDSATACCQGILQATQQQQQQQQQQQHANKASPELDVCVSQISAIPTIESLPQLATFSLIQYHGQNQPDTGSGQIPQQSIWTTDSIDEVDSSSNDTTTAATTTNYSKEQQQDTLYFPFLLEPVHPSPTVKIQSELSLDGGMHRLLHSHISSSTTTKSTTSPHSDTTTYLFLTLSNSMFMDLDDAILVQEDSSTAAASSVTVVHSAGVCDIEQPAFASGQHVVVLESKKSNNPTDSSAATTAALELISKVHFRYPVPSPDRHQWSILFLPQVLVAEQIMEEGGKIFYSTTATVAAEADASQETTQKVWVAAGSDADYVWVMGITLAMALLGTISMLQSFSLVSQWDA